MERLQEGVPGFGAGVFEGGEVGGVGGVLEGGPSGVQEVLGFGCASCGVGVISTCWAWVQAAMVTSRVSSGEGGWSVGRSRSMELTALAVVNGVNAVVTRSLLLLL